MGKRSLQQKKVGGKISPSSLRLCPVAAFFPQCRGHGWNKKQSRWGSTQRCWGRQQVLSDVIKVAQAVAMATAWAANQRTREDVAARLPMASDAGPRVFIGSIKRRLALSEPGWDKEKGTSLGERRERNTSRNTFFWCLRQAV